MSKLSVEELLAQATCAVLIDGQIAGTAWLASQEGHLLTAGHVLCQDIDACDEAYDEVEVQFTDDEPRIARQIEHHIQFNAGIDFAVLQVVDMPLDRKPLPISLTQSVELNSKLKLRGYGTTFSGPTIGEGKFKAQVDRQGSSSNRLFRYYSQELGEEGFSGGAVYSEQLGAVVAIQIEAVRKRFGPMSGMVLAMPLYRIAELSSEAIHLLRLNGKSHTTQLRQHPPKSPKSPLLKRGIEAATPRIEAIRDVLLFPFGLLTDKKLNNKASQRDKKLNNKDSKSLHPLQILIIALFVLVFVVAQVSALVPSFEWSLPELATVPTEEPAIAPAEEEWVEMPEAEPTPTAAPFIEASLIPVISPPPPTEWNSSEEKEFNLTPPLTTATSSLSCVVISQIGLNMRAQPSLASDDNIITRLSPNTPLTPLGRSGILPWLLVQIEGQEGWVASQEAGVPLVECNDDLLALPEVGSELSTSTSIPEPTSTSEPIRTSEPQPTLELEPESIITPEVSITATFTAVSTALPSLSLPVSASTPVPLPMTEISPANASEVIELARWDTDEYVSVLSVTFSPDGNTLVSGHSDDTGRQWLVEDGTLLHILEFPLDVRGISFSPDSPDANTPASAFWDKVPLWSDWLLFNTLEGHIGKMNSVAFIPDGRTMASGSLDDTLQLWSSDSTLINSLDQVTLGVMGVAFSPDGNTLASAFGNEVRLWSSKDGTLMNTLRGHESFVTTVAFSPDGRTIASGSLDNSVRLWSSDGTLINTLDEHTSGVTSVAFSPNGDTIASGSLDDTVRLWSSDGTLINTLNEHTSEVTSVAFTLDGKKLASGSTDNTVRLWKLDGTPLNTLEAHTSSVESIIFSPDSKTLASGSLDGTVYLWRASDGKLLVTLKKHTDSVESVAFSPDGRILASGSQDSTIRLWGVQGRSQNLGGLPR